MLQETLTVTVVAVEISLHLITYRFALYKSFRNILLQMNIEIRHRFEVNIIKEDVLGFSVLQGNVSEEVHGVVSLQHVDSGIGQNGLPYIAILEIIFQLITS